MKKILKDIQELSLIDKYYTFTFNLSDLPDVDNYSFDIRKNPVFESFFKDLNEKKTDCLYWFELSSNDNALVFKETLNSLRDKLKNKPNDKRVIPVDNPNVDSNVVYVGVKKGGGRKHTIKNRKRVPDELSYIAGRMIQHLGYYHKGSTQGLQLAHWSRNFDFNITINILELDEVNSDYLYILEKMYAIKYKPLLGTH